MLGAETCPGVITASTAGSGLHLWDSLCWIRAPAGLARSCSFGVGCRQRFICRRCRAAQAWGSCSCFLALYSSCTSIIGLGLPGVTATELMLCCRCRGRDRWMVSSIMSALQKDVIMIWKSFMSY